MSFGSRLAPGSPPGAILERFSSLRGAILERFWKDFRALGKLSSELSGLCVGPPSATFFPDTHAREEDTGETQERHRRNTPEKRNTPETQEGDGRTNGGTRQSYGRNTKETQEEHLSDVSFSGVACTFGPRPRKTARQCKASHKSKSKTRVRARATRAKARYRSQGRQASRMKGPGGIREPACTFAYHA